MKTIFIFLIFIVQIFPQTQNKIPWPSLANSPWPTLRGDMQATGRSEFVGPETLNIKWMGDYPLGIIEGPVIGYGNKLFFGTDALNNIGENYFYAVNPDSSLFWRYVTNNSWPNSVAPLITKDSTIIFFANTGELYALDYYGNLKWKKYVTNHYMQPSIDLEGNIYVTSTDTLKVLKQDGSELLTKYFEKIQTRISFSPNGQTLYFLSGSIYFNATDLQGNIKWRIKFNSAFSNQASPLVDNVGNIYLSGMDTLRRPHFFSVSDQGIIRWKYPVFLEQFSEPCIDNEGNIILAGKTFDTSYVLSDTNYIISLDYYGNLNWKYALGEDDEPNSGMVCDAKGNIFFGATWGTYFQALDKNGKLLWKLPLKGYEYDTSPSIGSDGTLYIGLHISTFFRDHKDNLIAIGKTPVNVEDENIKVDEFSLSQNYPNPFNP
ncbi:MAG: hypothetical protein ACM3O3_01495, partial [Syntrophothermus sp.]